MTVRATGGSDGNVKQLTHGEQEEQDEEEGDEDEEEVVVM
jgi:hypothetical protein